MRNIYHRLPDSVKKVIDFIWGIIPLGLKFGPIYCYYKLLLKNSQWWDKQQHEAYQLKQLKKLCIHAYRHVPYYRRIFNEYHFDPFKISSVKEIEILPFLDKDIIEKNFKDLIADNISKRKISISTTGGTSGHQLSFATLKYHYGTREYPFVDLIWSRVEFKRNRSRMGVLRNQILPSGVLCEYDGKNRSYIFDTYHLTDENIAEILKTIQRLKIEYLHTYPSAVMILSDYINRKNIKYSSSLKAILATSENIYPGQKEVIEKALQCRLFTFYGHSECACIAGWCEKTDLYHIQSEYGYCELIDEQKKSIHEADKRGEIVCTGFGNYVMPLIRYRTGDYSSFSKEEHCACGRNYKLLNEIEGRWTQEMFVGKDHNYISMTALNMHDEIFRYVENYQFEQNEIGKCILRIVKAPQYTADDEKAIRKALERKFDTSIEIEFQYVKVIERTQRGKQRYIIQKLELK